MQNVNRYALVYRLVRCQEFNDAIIRSKETILQVVVDLDQRSCSLSLLIAISNSSRRFGVSSSRAILPLPAGHPLSYNSCTL